MRVSNITGAIRVIRVIWGITIPVLAMTSLPNLYAQRYNETDALRIALIRAQAEADSLRYELVRLSSQHGSTWDGLTGLEEDGEQMFAVVGKKAFENDNNRELMSEVRAACPSLGMIPFNAAIKQQIAIYSETKRKMISYAIARYRSYLPDFKKSFDKYGVPEDIIALVIVESAVSPRALSPVGAAGMWQLMPETAVRYGLRVDDYVDERYDPKPSCDAAARYLKNAYTRYGDWSLAIASYNCGPGNVNRAIARAGKNANIWDVLQYLPAETRNYYPSFIAARYALTFSDFLDIPERTVTRPLLYRVSLPYEMNMQKLASETGMDVEYIVSLNPHIKGDIIPSFGCEIYLSKEGYQKLKSQK